MTELFLILLGFLMGILVTLVFIANTGLQVY